MRPDAPWDDGDEADLPFGTDGIGLDGVATYPIEHNEFASEDDWSRAAGYAVADQPELRLDVSFTVSNPSGTLSASAGIGGRLQRIDLTGVSRLNEVQLGEEILEMASLASAKARSAQHEVTVELMRGLGQDGAGVSALLEHSVGLPTYESTNVRIAEVISARYRTYDD
ncbi:MULTISPECIES: hypothetical protein [Mycobacteriaceae]|uniref:Uncharacterized protein n=1 Tax=Mycolicibacterium parafortuitum TaxID=39692 RepID=A0ACC6MED8_MYCPF|nr:MULTISPECIES: hypothetical protein [Mycobacteriaceae]MDZ5085258.1 hypothetical protein [Mycolicibacterium parafortuitum]